MKTLVQKVVAIILSVSMLITCIPVCIVFAEENESSGIEKANTRPGYFSLKDLGFVTSVKNQNPYGTCWGFAGIAAAESTILFQLGMTNEEYIEKFGHELDLSERALTWYERTALNEETAPMSVFGSQAGEGTVVTSLVDLSDKNVVYDVGGMPHVVAAAFASGIGPKYEESAPYQGENGVKAYIYEDPHGKLYKVNGATYADTTGTDEAILKDYPISYAAYYSKVDDWTLPENERFGAEVNLIESNMLRSPVVTREDAATSGSEEETIQSVLMGGKVFDHIDLDAINAMKDELLEGKALEIGYCADTFSPEQTDTKAKYINTDTYAHYTYKLENMNHAVTVVGYDDHYSRYNFLDHSNDPDGDGQAHLPEGDGAFIVKNSWGSSDQSFPHYHDWGVDGSGYFYLSYYDRSITDIESFTFDVSGLTSGALDYAISQYDLMQPSQYDRFGEGHDIRMANIFCAPANEILDRIAFTTAERDTDVKVEIYLLNNGYVSPEDGALFSVTNRHLEDSGIHTLVLEKATYLKEGTFYSVVVTQMINEDGKEKNVGTVGTATSAELNEALGELAILQGSFAVSSGNAVINPGESYVCVDGKWLDWSSEGADVMKETIENYRVEMLNMGRAKGDVENGSMTMEELQAILMNEEEGAVNPYMDMIVAKSIDNFPIKAYSQKTSGNISGFDFNVSENRIMTIKGSGDLNVVLQKGIYEFGPWLELFTYVDKIVIEPTVTGLTDENGNVSTALYGFGGKVVYGDHEYNLEYGAKKFK